MLSYRRVVTGHDDQGRSCVIIDDGGGAQSEGAFARAALLWQSDSVPASNQGNADAAATTSLAMPAGGNKLFISRFEPTKEMAPPGWHGGGTLDYVIILRGRLTMILETEEVDLEAGDIVISRGVLHGWHNRGTEDAIMIATIIDAEPKPGPS